MKEQFTFRRDVADAVTKYCAENPKDCGYVNTSYTYFSKAFMASDCGRIFWQPHSPHNSNVLFLLTKCTINC